jgi:hypothetical protein
MTVASNIDRRGVDRLAALQSRISSALAWPSPRAARPGLAERFDQAGHPGSAGDQARLTLDIDLEIQPIRHRCPAPRW